MFAARIAGRTGRPRGGAAPTSGVKTLAAVPTSQARTFVAVRPSRATTGAARPSRATIAAGRPSLAMTGGASRSRGTTARAAAPRTRARVPAQARAAMALMTAATAAMTAATVAAAATTSSRVSPLRGRMAPASAGAAFFLREREDFVEMAGERRKILLVEDERSITEPLAAALEREGFDAQVAGTVAEALELAGQLDPDLVLLDVMLPDGSGFDVCRELRRTSRVPIIMLTARGEETDRVIGLELGADDYVVKPFSAREVTARIRAVLRRAEQAPAADDGAIEIGEV